MWSWPRPALRPKLQVMEGKRKCGREESGSLEYLSKDTPDKIT